MEKNRTELASTFFFYSGLYVLVAALMGAFSSAEAFFGLTAVLNIVVGPLTIAVAIMLLSAIVFAFIEREKPLVLLTSVSLVFLMLTAVQIYTNYFEKYIYIAFSMFYALLSMRVARRYLWPKRID